MLGNLGDERIRERKLGKKAGFEKESLKEDAHKSFHKIKREKNVQAAGISKISPRDLDCYKLRQESLFRNMLSLLGNKFSRIRTR